MKHNNKDEVSNHITIESDSILTFSFCESFIEQMADYLFSQYVQTGKGFDRVGIVFGGKRPALFLKRALAKRIKKVFVPPVIFTIDEFIRHIVRQHENVTQANELDQCYQMYQLAKEKAPEILQSRENFAEFLPWSREIIAFIDQLDLENIQSSNLLNVQANADIGYDVPKEVNRLLSRMTVLRDAYHQYMRQQKVYSRGYQYLRASTLIQDCAFPEFDQFLFCNFFYFHETEKKVVESLYRRNQAKLFFQGDQRKWPVFKRISRQFNCHIHEAQEVPVPEFDLKLYSCFDAHSQVAKIREIISSLTEQQLSRSVIVLPSAEQIMPLLSEITTHIKDFNISMGYPLKRSSLYTLFSYIFQAQRSLKKDRYYAKDYLNVIKHPFVKNLQLSSDASVTRMMLHHIEDCLTGITSSEISGSTFIKLSDIEECEELLDQIVDLLQENNIDVSRLQIQDDLRSIHQLFFSTWELLSNFSRLAKVMNSVLNIIIQSSPMRFYLLNNNIANEMIRIVEEFGKSSFAGEEFEKNDLFQILDSKISREIVAFKGSPLKGLQILGLFETRSLNFDHVIVIDVNEGVLPKLKMYEPLIPREVMISMGLNRLELDEEIQRYQFMRLISSAANVHLIYQESREKEKSRFIEELVWEEQKKNNGKALTTVNYPRFSVDIAASEKTAQKTPAMVNYLRQHVYSSSSINMYLRNPYEFYLNYVLGLREKEDLLDEPDARLVGTFVHEVLEASFRPFVGKKPEFDKDFKNRFNKIFEGKFVEVFGRNMKSDAFLIKAILENRLVRFIDIEAENVQRQKITKIVYLEKRFEDTIHLPCGDFKFSYVVDRVDEMEDGTMMIIDYKTGSIDHMPSANLSLMDADLSREYLFEHVTSFQLPLYIHYLMKQYPERPINAALYSLKIFQLKKFLDEKMMANLAEIDRNYMFALNMVIEEILDEKIPFIDIS